MKTAKCHLKSTAPYSQSRFHDTPKGEKESNDDYERRTWREKLHVTEDGYVFIPPMSFKWCLEEAAQHLSVQIPGKGKQTYTKHFKRGILVTDGLVLPIKKEDVQPEWLFLNSDGRRGGGRRVKKALPTIKSWEDEVTFYIADEVITEEVFSYHVTQAGMFIGIGTHRPGNGGFKGRFEVVSIEWEEWS